MPKRNRPPHNLLLISPSISIRSNTQCRHHRLVTVAHLLKIMSHHLLFTLLFFCLPPKLHSLFSSIYAFTPFPILNVFFFENQFQFILVCFTKRSPNQSVTYCFCVCAPGWMLVVAHKTCGGNSGWKYFFPRRGEGGGIIPGDRPAAGLPVSCC